MVHVVPESSCVACLERIHQLKTPPPHSPDALQSRTTDTSPPATTAVDPHEMICPRLVRYYRIAGFKAEREVGEDLGSLRDRLTWGAEGTLMAASAEEFMQRWTSLMRETNTGSEGSGSEASGAAAVEKQEA